MPTETKECLSCRTPNDIGNSFCFRCGRDLRELGAGAAAVAAPLGGATTRGPLDVKWVFLSIIIIFGTASIVALVLDQVYRMAGLSEIQDLLMVFTIAVGVLLGGVVAGYTSPGITIKEPAVAAAAVTILFLIGNRQYADALWWWIAPFALAYMGAWLGERIQGTI